MNKEDPELSEICAICREELEGEGELDYRVSPSTIVCHDCARKYGGVYNHETETWTVPPRLPSRQRLGDDEG
jgi:ribosome-binding protein aMBF1 (putative translation factor)